MSIVFDIETGPLDEATVMASFDADSVKMANVKDPEKRMAKIEAAREAHLERAALSPLTGKVVAIGYLDDDGDSEVMGIGQNGINEKTVLETFWECFGDASNAGESMIGFNIFRFDLPFLVRRSLLSGITYQDAVIDSDRYWSPVFTDLFEKWRCGVHGEYVGLDAICTAIGVEGKPEDGTTGADFARLWFGKADDREKATKYLEGDLRMTRAVADRFGIF